MFDTHTDKFFADMTNALMEETISHMEEVAQDMESDIPNEFAGMCYEEVCLWLDDMAEAAIGF